MGARGSGERDTEYKRLSVTLSPQTPDPSRNPGPSKGPTEWTDCTVGTFQSTTCGRWTPSGRTRLGIRSEGGFGGDGEGAPREGRRTWSGSSGVTLSGVVVVLD